MFGPPIVAFRCCLHSQVAKAVLDNYFSKLRASELPDEDSYGYGENPLTVAVCIKSMNFSNRFNDFSDDVFADDIETKGTFGCNSISLAPLVIQDVLARWFDYSERIFTFFFLSAEFQ